MQQAAPLVAVERGVVVGVVADREARQHRVAVVAVRVDRVAPVGVVAPHRVGQVFVLRRSGQSAIALGVVRVRADHLLQEDDVGSHRAHGLAQLPAG